MLIDVLVCRADGTQTVETREAPEGYFGAPGEDGPAPLTADEIPIE